MSEAITWLIVSASVGAAVMGVFGLTIQCITIGVLAIAVLSIS
jgi:hypothetical protein